MELVEIIEISTDALLFMAVAFIAYRFYKVYVRTRDKVPQVLFSVFLLFSMVQFVAFIWHVIGKEFPYGEIVHEFLFLIAAISIAWALLPRVGWKSQLKNESKEKEEKEKLVA
jgi:cell shape-determining protein MreD